MTVRSSGDLSLNTDIVGEFGGSGEHSLSEYYAGKTGGFVPNVPGIPTSGEIKFSNFYGKTKTFTMTTNQRNLNLRTWLIGVGWDGTSSATAVVGTGVYVWSDSPTIPAVTINGSFPNGVTLINDGYIMGCGGKGGDGYNISSSGGDGGHAISLGVNATIINRGPVNVNVPGETLGFIGGGGGGGAGATGGGGGGAGGGAGGRGWSDGQGLAATYIGQGGSGGAVGQAGSPGTGWKGSTPVGFRPNPAPSGLPWSGEQQTFGIGVGGGGGGGGSSLGIFCSFGGGGGGRVGPGFPIGYGGYTATADGVSPTFIFGGTGRTIFAGGSGSSPVPTYGLNAGGGGGGWGQAGGAAPGYGKVAGSGGKAIALNGFVATVTNTGLMYGGTS